MVIVSVFSLVVAVPHSEKTVKTLTAIKMIAKRNSNCVLE
jgi:hypothetical protein